VDFAPLLKQLDATDAASKHFEAAVGTATPEQMAKANRVLLLAERALLISPGLPHRDWYRHSIYAPGMYTGYGAKTLPGIREAAEESRMEEATQQVGVAASAISEFNRRIEEAARLLR